MYKFYSAKKFRLFPCSLSKAPNVPAGTDWRDGKNHLNQEETDRIIDTGGYIGAWLPENMVVIDIDMNHKDKEGKPKPDGMGPFKALLEQVKIKKDLFKSTFVVKTGSGGYHLYFHTEEKLSQRSIAESVDVRTHAGYVIMAGVAGYTVYNDMEIAELPPELAEIMKRKEQGKAQPIRPTKKLSLDRLKKVFNKLEPRNFNTNDLWLELMQSSIATAGNEPEVLDILAEWSLRDPVYSQDQTIRKRLETFTPDGGITAGTFLFILKKEGVSKYLYDKVRMEVGADFQYTQDFSEQCNLPFTLDISIIYDHIDLVKSFYYTKNQAVGVTLCARILKKVMLYSMTERMFFYFNGNYWQEAPGVLEILFSLLLKIGEKIYTEISEPEDADAADLISSYISYIGNLGNMSRFEQALRQHSEMIYQDIQWDSPRLEGTLTLRDGVMDFSDKAIQFRSGYREEYRRGYIDLGKKDFQDRGNPEAFKEFLKDIFPDMDTRKTATYALATMISGTGKFRKFQIWNGNGKNGKSSLMNMVKMIIGKRAITYKPDILLSKRTMNGGPNPELAVFRGSLVAMSSETEEVKRISQGTVKQLTGNEVMTANPKYKDMIEFHTTFQLVLATNYLPTFSAHDNAFITRLLTIPFHTAFYSSEEEMDRARQKGARYFKEAKDLKEVNEAILKERASILYYLATRYQEISGELPESAECMELKNYYIESNDDIGKFIEDFVDYSTQPENGRKYYFTPTKDLVDFFNNENNSNYSSKFVVMRIREIFPNIETFSKMIDGKLTRGLKNIRLAYGAYPEGYMENFTRVEREEFAQDEAVAGNF